MEQQQINPSKRKRDNLQTWTLNGMRSGNLTPDQAESILDYKITVGGKQVAYRDQFPDFAAAVSDEMFKTRKRQQSEFNLREAERISTAEAELSQVIDGFAVDGDGRIDDNELETINQRAIQLGIPGSKIVEYAQQNSVSAATDRAVEAWAMKKADNLTLKVDDVMGVKMGANLRNKLLNIARQQQETRKSPVYKAHIQSIEAAVSQHPQIKAAPITGSANYSVVLMKDRYVQQYKQNLQRLDPEQALSLTLQQIKTMQAVPGAITKQGTYKEIEDQIKASSQGANVSLNRVNSILAAMREKVFDTDPEWAVGVVGEEIFNNFYSTLQAGGQPPELLKTLAARRGVDPLTLINHLAKGAKKPPIQPLNNQLKEIKDNLPPITRRLYDTYRTNERVERANAVVSNRVFQMPKRGSFANTPFDMSKLTKKDYDDLAFAISSEAQLGTDDEYGVAANILTRLMTGKYGRTINEIINAPGQYEGVYKGLSRPSPQIAARLQSPEGQKKIQEFIKILNGRTEFKGQTMLENRVPSEDPMFSPGGNFYHYAGQ